MRKAYPSRGPGAGLFEVTVNCHTTCGMALGIIIRHHTSYFTEQRTPALIALLAISRVASYRSSLYLLASSLTIQTMAKTEAKGPPVLRIWDLNKNSTRYDYCLLAAPSDEELTRYWTAWGVISTLGGAIVGLILLGILSSKNARM